MNKEQKIQDVTRWTEHFEKAKAMVFAEYRGLKVKEITELRQKLRAANSTMKVVKNRLVKRVLTERGLADLTKFFTNPTAIAMSELDPISPVKVLVEFAKTNAMLAIKAGYMDGAMLTKAQIEQLATLPSKEVLLSRALASMNAPATNLVGVLIALPRQLVNVVDAIRKKKESTN